jgi:hypothetical protein
LFPDMPNPDLLEIFKNLKLLFFSKITMFSKA